MPEVNYEAKLVPSQIESTLKKDILPTMTGQSFVTINHAEVLEVIDHPDSLTDGWDNDQLFIQSEQDITFNNTTRIINNRRVIPTLNGPVIVASNEVRVDSEDFVNFIGEEPVMGVKSAGTNMNARAFIFNRNLNKISIAKEFQYSHINGIRDKLLVNQFTEIDNEGQDFFIFQMEAPIPVSLYKYSSLEVTTLDYLKTSFDYNHILLKNNISEVNFLEMCDYVSILREDFNDADEHVYEWVFEEDGMIIYTNYFPIYTHVTVIARYVHNEVIYDTDDITILDRRATEYLYQVGISFYDDIDPISGSIKISPEFASDAIGTLYGFYIFYGTSPAVYINPQTPTIRLDDLLEEDRQVTHIAINDTDNYGNMSIDNNLIHITNAVIPTSETTNVIMPFRFKRFFIEPSANIYINNEYVKANKKFWIDNEGVNNIQFRAPVHILEMLEPAIMNGTTIETGNNSISDIAAVYGVFQYGSDTRATLAAITTNNTGVSTDLASVALGYGEGPYGAGGYGQGEIQTFGTVVYYQTGGQIITPNGGSVGVQVKPIDIGYEIVLPAWAKESTILVQEVTERKAEAFNDWVFIEPDILILDKNKAHDYATYNITFEVSIHPVIPLIDINNGTIDIVVQHNPESIYSHFKGYYLLHSKEINVKVGYMDNEGARQYFSKELTVNMVLEEEYLERVVTGTKTILL
ncbi:MAG: hypothetical protein DRQ78_00770 [Epsilonproteobacteria bacterium]|nr:MAG: hypothetical protein DRQ78_00770 [Campylobacterota bacterium]